MKYKNLTLIGTSHIAKESVNTITKTFFTEEPDIVAVELDRNRLLGLLSKRKRKLRLSDIRRIGLKGFLFALIGGYVQEKLGKLVGTMPGSDMLAAINLAKTNKKKLALIDQDITITMRRLSKTFSWREKWTFVKDIFRSIFFGKRELKKLGIDTLDLTKVPSEKIIEKMILRLKSDYPNLYNVLILERNYVMAANLIRMMKDEPEQKIMAVVGAGHLKDMLTIIKANV